ncbi:diaminopimelate epimerase [Micromonospora cathayae]|uniref:Diaminopimelate epimerase n=1 Tax=Micromonospora cathayae TaxID=3028804 RepID=A0ABY7ZXP5_9ACTN|nr:diaminopimelate epimerase [Micromonospora sp. HUAS 3]WDZ87586.1 diaminopimelate epimerase [Micromonospora sp. HUAS 3]
MEFTKGHGTGNDFVILPDPDGQLDLTPEQVAAICDRRRGIGADGVLRVVRSAKHPDAAGQAGEAEWFMDYRNADGSVAEMCGNGARVFVHYLITTGLATPTSSAATPTSSAASASTAPASAAAPTSVAPTAAVPPGSASDGSLLSGSAPDGSLLPVPGSAVDGSLLPVSGSGAGRSLLLPVATRAGVVRARIDGETIAVELRRPRLYDSGTATLGGLTLPGTAVDVGNPHLVCPLPAGLDLAALDLTHPPGVDPALFPAGVNVEFTTPGDPVDGTDAQVRMRVHERGSAETMSCGTGACAVAAVALRDTGRDTGTVTVDVPGGRLTVTVTPDSCWLAGPATLVATGTLLHP